MGLADAVDADEIEAMTARANATTAAGQLGERSMSALDICGGPFGVVKPDGGLGLSRHLRSDVLEPSQSRRTHVDAALLRKPCTETMWEGAIMRLMVAIGAALVAVAMLLTPASAQRDLSALLPAPDELPTGFALRPDGERREEANGARALRRAYVRQNPEVGPDDRTGMILFVYAGTSPIQGKEIYQNAIASFTSGGWSFEPLNPPLGDEAVVGRKSFGTDETGRESESVLIYFRVGPLVGAVEWDDYSDLPNRDLALGVAKTIHAHLVADMNGSSGPS